MQTNVFTEKSVSQIQYKVNDFLGKILEDEKTVESYKIEEKNFVVIMVTKVRNHIIHVTLSLKLSKFYSRFMFSYQWKCQDFLFLYVWVSVPTCGSLWRVKGKLDQNAPNNLIPIAAEAKACGDGGE